MLLLLLLFLSFRLDGSLRTDFHAYVVLEQSALGSTACLSSVSLSFIFPKGAQISSIGTFVVVVVFSFFVFFTFQQRHTSWWQLTQKRNVFFFFKTKRPAGNRDMRPISSAKLIQSTGQNLFQHILRLFFSYGPECSSGILISQWRFRAKTLIIDRTFLFFSF